MKKFFALIFIGSIFLVGCDQNQMAGDQEINQDAPAASELEAPVADDDMGSMEAVDQEQEVMEEPTTMGQEQMAEPAAGE